MRKTNSKSSIFEGNIGSELINSRPNEQIFLKVTTSSNPSVSRGCSPNFDSKFREKQWNGELYTSEEGDDLIQDVVTLSSAVGLVKSFSTTDITHLPYENLLESTTTRQKYLRNAYSEMVISSVQQSNYILEKSKLEKASRSCSTWVTVGDISSTSQLPSPHSKSSNIVPITHCANNTSAVNVKNGQIDFTAADFICCINKRIRQQYIKKRLLTIYRALQCLSQSEFNLDKLEVCNHVSAKLGKKLDLPTSPLVSQYFGKESSSSQSSTSTIFSKMNSNVGKNFLTTQKKLLTVRDVDREKGQPLSKYDRNMMIFNWLLTLNFECDN